MLAIFFCAISESEDNQIHVDYFDGGIEYLDITISENKELVIKLILKKDLIFIVHVYFCL